MDNPPASTVRAKSAVSILLMIMRICSPLCPLMDSYYFIFSIMASRAFFS